MLSDLQWRYAKFQHEDQQGQHWYGSYSHYTDPMLNLTSAFEDMEQRQFEQDMYDEFENPACDYTQSFEHHQHHHELAEPLPAWKILTDGLTKLLEA